MDIRMAGRAVRPHIFEYGLDVTAYACHSSVEAAEWKRRLLIVTEVGHNANRLPGRSGVAAFARQGYCAMRVPRSLFRRLPCSLRAQANRDYRQKYRNPMEAQWHAAHSFGVPP
jgi:hypothetical protein